MANPSNVSMLLRLVGGNTATPHPGDAEDEGRVSAHSFIAALQMWSNGEITKAMLVTKYNFTHADDSGDLNDLNGWYAAATNQSKFSDILEWRIILARDKRGVSGVDLNGAFGYAVKATLINGADGAHSLKNTGPIAARFNTWA